MEIEYNELSRKNKFIMRAAAKSKNYGLHECTKQERIACLRASIRIVLRSITLLTFDFLTILKMITNYVQLCQCKNS